MASVPTHKSAEPGSLVIRITFAAPDTYYIKDHYKEYSAGISIRIPLHPRRGEVDYFDTCLTH